jgi:hypothetical protein
MSKKHLLPTLIPQHTVSNINETGSWENRNADELEKISKGLKVEQVQIQINSIPDVWARPLLFEMGLFDPDHPLNEEVLGEWRGLLALVGLKEIRKITKLTAQKIQISSNDHQHSQRFSEVLTKLIPKRSLAPDTTWNNLYLFLFDTGGKKSAIGMTSPTTIVSTATHYFNKIHDIDWFDGKILVDPGEFLSKREKVSLSGWLAFLKKKLENHPGVQAELVKKPSDLLGNYIEDLEVSTSTFVPSTKGLGITSNEFGFFVHLDKPASAPPDNPYGSDVRVINSQGLAPKKPMLLLDEDIATKWGVNLQDVTAYGALTLASLSYSQVNEQHNKIGDVEIKEAEVWTIKQLFTEKLLVVQSGEAFPGALKPTIEGNSIEFNNSPITLILPIKKQILDYISPQDLIQRVRVEQLINGDIEIRLRLTLSGINNINKDYTATRVYSSDDLEIINQLPILEIFPNFQNNTWNAYYIAYSTDNKDKTFQITPSTSVRNKAEVFVQNNPTAERTITEVDQYPGAVFCSYRNQEIGLLLLAPPIKVQSRNATYTVGVDFGASGTSVYASDGTTKQALEFNDNRKLAVTQISPTQRPQVLELFLPEETVHTPFLSLFQDFHNKKQEQHLPFLNGHVYFYNNSAVGGLDRNDILADLKWSPDAYTRICVKSFLKQIYLQTAAELVSQGASTINWKFSYPTAFSEDVQLPQYQNIWNQIVEECYPLTLKEIKTETQADGTIISTEISTRPAPPVELTESIAAAQYFREKQNAATSLGSVFIDIGSSTSDISVWQSDKLLWQISILYAGRDIFLDYIRAHPEIFNTFKLPINTAARDKSKIYAEIDSILQNNNVEIFNALPYHADTEPIPTFKQHLAVGLAGLFFYIGSSVRHLLDKGLYAPNMPQIWVGGNGSKMFRWLVDGGQFTTNSPVVALFKHAFVKGVGNSSLNGSFTLQMSESPKHEAAYGLVSNLSLSRSENYSTGIIAGETFLQNGDPMGWSETINKQKLREHTIEPPLTFTKMSEFIEAFNEFAADRAWLRRVSLSDQQLHGIRGSVANKLSANPDLEGFVVEPVFILALKDLLRNM